MRPSDPQTGSNVDSEQEHSMLQDNESDEVDNDDEGDEINLVTGS